MTFGEHLKTKILTLCSERQLSINRLATLSGLTQSTVDSILKGKSRNPKIGTLYSLSKGFEMDFVGFLQYVCGDYDFADD